MSVDYPCGCKVEVKQYGYSKQADMIYCESHRRLIFYQQGYNPSEDKK